MSRSSSYGVTDTEFAEIADAIKSGDLSWAKDLLDTLIEGYVDQAVDDFKDDQEAEAECPDLTQAKEELRVGRRQEGMIFLERFLGSEFIGVLAR